MSQQDDNFLSRWSRRKALVRQGVPPPPEAAPPVAVAPAVPAAVAAQLPNAAATAGPPAGASVAEADAAPAPPRLTLDDVEALTPESDFSRFIQRDVDEKVKNSAMKKLFTDPHYNVMDGLDIYIGDYNTPDPLPKSMLRQLVQARMLGLLDDELPEQPRVDEVAPDAPLPAQAGVAAAAEDAVEVEVEPAVDAANDAAETGADLDASGAALPALPGVDAALPGTLALELPLTASPTPAMPAPSDGPWGAATPAAVAQPIGARDDAQPGPGSASKSS